MTNGMMMNNGTSVGDMARVICKPGYKLNGPHIIVCLNNGNLIMTSTNCTLSSQRKL